MSEIINKLIVPFIEAISTETYSLKDSHKQDCFNLLLQLEKHGSLKKVSQLFNRRLHSDELEEVNVNDVRKAIKTVNEANMGSGYFSLLAEELKDNYTKCSILSITPKEINLIETSSEHIDPNSHYKYTCDKWDLNKMNLIEASERFEKWRNLFDDIARKHKHSIKRENYALIVNYY